MKPRSNDTRLRRLLSNRAPGILTDRTTKGVFQRTFRTVRGSQQSNVPKWG